jgi:hypothetical protein
MLTKGELWRLRSWSGNCFQPCAAPVYRKCAAVKACRSSTCGAATALDVRLLQLFNRAAHLCVVPCSRFKQQQPAKLLLAVLVRILEYGAPLQETECLLVCPALTSHADRRQQCLSLGCQTPHM